MEPEAGIEAKTRSRNGAEQNRPKNTIQQLA